MMYCIKSSRKNEVSPLLDGFDTDYLDVVSGDSVRRLVSLSVCEYNEELEVAGKKLAEVCLSLYREDDLEDSGELLTNIGFDYSHMEGCALSTLTGLHEDREADADLDEDDDGAFFYRDQQRLFRLAKEEGWVLPAAVASINDISFEMNADSINAMSYLLENLDEIVAHHFECAIVYAVFVDNFQCGIIDEDGNFLGLEYQEEEARKILSMLETKGFIDGDDGASGYFVFYKQYCFPDVNPFEKTTTIIHGYGIVFVGSCTKDTCCRMCDAKNEAECKMVCEKAASHPVPENAEAGDFYNCPEFSHGMCMEKVREQDDS